MNKQQAICRPVHTNTQTCRRRQTNRPSGRVMVGLKMINHTQQEKISGSFCKLCQATNGVLHSCEVPCKDIHTPESFMLSRYNCQCLLLGFSNKKNKKTTDKVQEKLHFVQSFIFLPKRFQKCVAYMLIPFYSWINCNQLH